VENNLIALIDLDGTVADFDKVMAAELNRLKAPEEPEYNDARDWEKPWIKARRRYIKNAPGFWHELPVIDTGMQVVGLLRSHGFHLMVLTKGPHQSTQAWAEKTMWVHKWIPDAGMTITTDKSGYYGKVLFDDWPDYIEPWLKHRPRGRVIMTDQPWNKDFSHPQVLRYTGDLQEVNDMLIDIQRETNDDRRTKR
jgi:5'-nucleotidase